MARLNHHYTKLTPSSIFSQIAQKKETFLSRNPEASLLDLSLGKSGRFQGEAALAALVAATVENRRENSSAQGHLFLREAIAQGDYAHLAISSDEIFISDGAESDAANIQEIFAIENRIAAQNPSSPAYIEANVMAGRTRTQLKNGGYGGVLYLDCTEENGFCPEVPNRPADLLYISSPNNPMGVTIPRDRLEALVRYAKDERAVLLFDSTYHNYIHSSNTVRSIYEIEGAKEVAIELRDFLSLRASYLVIPRALKIVESFQTFSVHTLWKKRIETKCSAVPYPIQKAAAALYTEKGKEETAEMINADLEAAKQLTDQLTQAGYKVFGGQDAPFLWLQAPRGLSSGEFADKLLTDRHIVATPGNAFGTEGEGYVRLSVFARASEITSALQRIAS